MSTPAPGKLKIVQDFINTVDLESGADDLASPQILEAWLAARGLLGDPGVQADGDALAIARAVREALREVIATNHDGAAPPAQAVATLNEVAARAPLTLVFGPNGGAETRPDAIGVDAALAALLSIVAEAMADGTWRRLKACQKESCRWAFYDHARNRSGKWCSMAVCGNRVKAQTYRQRQGDEA